MRHARIPLDDLPAPPANRVRRARRSVMAWAWWRRNWPPIVMLAAVILAGMVAR